MGVVRSVGVFDVVDGLVGATPMVRVPPSLFGLVDGVELLVKLEMFNPGGSSKDRPVLEMLARAEASGLLRPGGTIVEPTSGNTGAALAMLSAVRGYRFVAVMPDKVSLEKRALLAAYGAEVLVCPTSVAPDSPDSYYSVADRVARERDAFRPDQYHNPANADAHAVTGEEIFEATGGRVTHVVAGAGTCGTVTGVARRLRELVPKLRVVVADPSTSIFSGGPGGPYLVEGVGEDFFPAAWQPGLYDEVVPVADADAFAAARMLARRCGLLVGGSTGLAFAGLAFARLRPAAGDVVVVISPDSGRGYLSKFHDDGWMVSNGFSLASFDPCRRAVMPSTPADVCLVDPDDVPPRGVFTVVTSMRGRVVRGGVVGVCPPFSSAPTARAAAIGWVDGGVAAPAVASRAVTLLWDQGVLAGLVPPAG